MSEININAQHGMIAIVGVTNLENKEWIMQLPFVIINAGEGVLHFACLS